MVCFFTFTFFEFVYNLEYLWNSCHVTNISTLSDAKVVPTVQMSLINHRQFTFHKQSQLLLIIIILCGYLFCIWPFIYIYIIHRKGGPQNWPILQRWVLVCNSLILKEHFDWHSLFSSAGVTVSLLTGSIHEAHKITVLVLAKNWKNQSARKYMKVTVKTEK